MTSYQGSFGSPRKSTRSVLPTHLSTHLKNSKAFPMQSLVFFLHYALFLRVFNSHIFNNRAVFTNLPGTNLMLTSIITQIPFEPQLKNWCDICYFPADFSKRLYIMISKSTISYLSFLRTHRCIQSRPGDVLEHTSKFVPFAFMRTFSVTAFTKA